MSAPNGSVTQSPDKAKYAYGETVTLTASPATGYGFDGWVGAPLDKENANPLTITMNTSRVLTATFAKKTYTKKTYALILNAPTHGSVTQSPDKAEYQHGETVTLTSSPATGYVFDKWTGDVPLGKERDNPLTLTMGRGKDSDGDICEEDLHADPHRTDPRFGNLVPR